MKTKIYKEIRILLFLGTFMIVVAGFIPKEKAASGLSYGGSSLLGAAIGLLKDQTDDKETTTINHNEEFWG